MTHILLLIGQVSFYLVIPVEDHVYTKDSPAPLKMPIIWIIVYYIGAAAMALSTAFMNKSIQGATLSRGVFLGANSFITSCGTLLIDGVGGHVYDRDKRNPYVIAMSGESLVILVMIVLAIFRQMKV